ncbi:hypothetical protein [Pseudonocardia sp.]
MSAVVIVLETLAIALAVAVFGPFVLLVGVPAFVATLLVLLTAVLAERRRVRREEAAAALPTVPGGLMSGFFRVAAQPAVAQPPVPAQPVAAQPVAAQPVAAQPVAAQPVAAQPVPPPPGRPRDVRVPVRDVRVDAAERARS